MADVRQGGRSQSRSWLRRYPPVVTFLIALIITLIIMPSALNLPQANPTTVVEYAPIPPEDEDQPPPQEGSLSTLGLGTSNTVATEGRASTGLKIPKPGKGENPIVKRCVKEPSGTTRQTEDPNSPPCVPFFQGENGGATYRGVTKDEVVAVVYQDAHQAVGSDAGYESSPPAGSICDVDGPPDDPKKEGCINGEQTQDHGTVKIIRALARYFNDRFQTYNRHVHVYVYWSSAPNSPSGRRSEVQDMYERLKPFAAIDFTHFGGSQYFVEASVKRRISIYASYAMLPNKVYRENAPFLWSFWPDVEHEAALYHEYVCKRVAPYPVTHSGNSGDMGKKRKYGLLYTTDPDWPGQRYFAELMKARLKRGCPNGAEIKVANEYTYPRNGWSQDTHPDEAQKARENIQRMRLDGVTTILWLGGYETQHSVAADEASWYPEWVLAGDVQNDQTEEASYQQQDAWRHAWIATNQLREDRIAEAPCRQAYRQSEPYGTANKELEACALYRSFFMLFRGVQVAGPFLTPDAVDQGNHSLPRKESKNPATAACYYDPGDFTCVKDAQESWWDPDAPNPNGSNDATAGLPGCWRMANGGIRHVSGGIPPGDDVFKKSANTPCNTVGDNQSSINPFGPAG